MPIHICVPRPRILGAQGLWWPLAPHRPGACPLAAAALGTHFWVALGHRSVFLGLLHRFPSCCGRLKSSLHL